MCFRLKAQTVVLVVLRVENVYIAAVVLLNEWLEGNW